MGIIQLFIATVVFIALFTIGSFIILPIIKFVVAIVAALIPIMLTLLGVLVLFAILASLFK